MGRIVLAENQYGKAEVRLVRVTRDTELGVTAGQLREIAVLRLKGLFA